MKKNKDNFCCLSQNETVGKCNDDAGGINTYPYEWEAEVPLAQVP